MLPGDRNLRFLYSTMKEGWLCCRCKTIESCLGFDEFVIGTYLRTTSTPFDLMMCVFEADWEAMLIRCRFFLWISFQCFSANPYFCLIISPIRTNANSNFTKPQIIKTKRETEKQEKWKDDDLINNNKYDWIVSIISRIIFIKIVGYYFVNTRMDTLCVFQRNWNLKIFYELQGKF